MSSAFLRAAAVVELDVLVLVQIEHPARNHVVHHDVRLRGVVPDLQQRREYALEEGCDYGVHGRHDRQVLHALGSDLLEGALAAHFVEALGVKGALAHLVNYAKERAPRISWLIIR